MRYKRWKLVGDDTRGWRIYYGGIYFSVRRTLQLAKNYVDNWRDD